MSEYTKVALLDVEDQAAAMGIPGIQARFVRDGLGTDQTGVALHDLEPGARQPFGHVHNKADEVYIVLEGSGTAKVGDEDVTLNELDLITIPASSPRAFEAGGDGMRLLAVGQHFAGDGRILPGWWGGEVPPADAG